MKIRRVIGTLMLEALILVLLTVVCVSMIVKVSRNHVLRVMHMQQQNHAEELNKALEVYGRMHDPECPYTIAGNQVQYKGKSYKVVSDSNGMLRVAG